MDTEAGFAWAEYTQEACRSNRIQAARLPLRIRSLRESESPLLPANTSPSELTAWQEAEPGVAPEYGVWVL